MSQILAQYEHRKEGSKEIQLFPVSISDVDEMWIWLTVHKSPFEQWHVAVPWSQIVNELLPRGVKQLLDDESRNLDPQQDGGGTNERGGEVPDNNPRHNSLLEDLTEPN